MIDVIIPARNEEITIGDILTAFMPALRINSIFVVIDPDTADATEEAAKGILKDRDNAHVIHSPEAGKGQCVRYALKYVDTDRVMFCDADYLGLTRFHVERMTVEYGGVMIGVPRMPSNLPPRSYPHWPWVSGFRTVPMMILKDLDLHGYLMETQINHAAYDYNISPTWLHYMRDLYSPYRMSDKRIREMERDREWGLKNGVLQQTTG